LAVLSSYRRIYDQDYQGPYQSLVSQLATPINQSFTELYAANNNGLTFSDNFLATVQTFTVTVDSNGIPKNNTQFVLGTYQTTLSGLFVINCVGAQNATSLPTGGIFISFKKQNNNVSIQNVKGLTPNVSYSITVVALG
jgi:hypothetical protein